MAGSILTGTFAAFQVLYFASLAVVIYFYTRPVDWVEMDDLRADPFLRFPDIMLLYPVLREAEETMRTTLVALAEMDYPRERYRVVSIPNHDDVQTIESLRRLQREFPFLEILPVPPTSDPSWSVVWAEWDANPKAYWWHVGKRTGSTALPPKKTRQLVYAMYSLFTENDGNSLLSYIDADSAPPKSLFRAAAVGIRRYDVLQSTNVAGNLLRTWASSWHSMDHMCWDGSLYPHLSDHGRQPYWVLGKGLFFKVTDLFTLGGFNPWLTIEDPEVGMRLWANGRKIGMIHDPLIEEVPETIRGGITQRKRWVCGFFQSLHAPLRLMGMSFRQRVRARLNFVPCLSLLANPIGLATGGWAIYQITQGDSPVTTPLVVLCVANVVAALVVLSIMLAVAWKRTRLVLSRRRQRLAFLFRVNPVFLLIYWTIWTVPILIGFQMFLRDRGQVWERTEKIDANHELVRVTAHGPSVEEERVAAGDR
ncbi:MAG TPA: glycosyltransferase family 2 protein [Mycobacteriales bacterium]|nr:glycosyltransferase family 2 protein [Mycobacteriales bacterium]